MNLDLDYWRPKFLYPYALDPAPMKVYDDNGAIITTVGPASSGGPKDYEMENYKFPLNLMANKREYFEELQKPVEITVDQIMRDLLKFNKDFPRKIVLKRDERIQQQHCLRSTLAQTAPAGGTRSSSTTGKNAIATGIE